jgi:hypothetical protein
MRISMGICHRETCKYQVIPIATNLTFRRV